ncbi:MAG: DUF5652 family protein [Patescibacteria group bacterium]|nr:hypothetical protein [Patescibacteria group bacterium]MBU1349867.1 hypothetical protein [Patescibacteria group bacterium]MBU1778091.1 hypothetical protein [Patescibacteria group bacterium]MBU2456858.1 hypothetical protein [Patescibacteria group bacterium]MBU2474799.1 hypothetical protein [Patescibacteria group bacterium]
MEKILIQNSFIIWVLILSILWILPWKAYALWRAAKLNQKYWFIVLFLLNTFAILEILYIFIFSKRKKINETINYTPWLGGDKRNME